MYDGSVITVVDIVDTMMTAAAKSGRVGEGFGSCTVSSHGSIAAATDQLLKLKTLSGTGPPRQQTSRNLSPTVPTPPPSEPPDR